MLARGADPDAPDNHPWTPLFTAVRSARSDVMIALADHGANVNFVSATARWRLPAGTSVLHVACRAAGATPEAIKMLIRRGADPRIEDAEDQRPLDVARANARDDIVSCLMSGASRRDA